MYFHKFPSLHSLITPSCNSHHFCTKPVQFPVWQSIFLILRRSEVKPQIKACALQAKMHQTSVTQRAEKNAVAPLLSGLKLWEGCSTCDRATQMVFIRPFTVKSKTWAVDERWQTFQPQFNNHDVKQLETKTFNAALRVSCFFLCVGIDTCPSCRNLKAVVMQYLDSVPESPGKKKKSQQIYTMTAVWREPGLHISLITWKGFLRL